MHGACPFMQSVRASLANAKLVAVVRILSSSTCMSRTKLVVVAHSPDEKSINISEIQVQVKL